MKKTRAKKRQPSEARAGKSGAAKSRRPKPKARAAKSNGAGANLTKALARRWFEELWNKRNGAALIELMDPAAIGDTEGGVIVGHAGFAQQLHAPLLGAFPDFRVTVDGVIAESEEAAVRWTFYATHSGDFLGIPASNRRVSVSGISWLKYKNGKLISGWDRWNANGLVAYLKDGTTCATVRMPA